MKKQKENRMKDFHIMMSLINDYRKCGEKLNYIQNNLMIYGEDTTLKEIKRNLVHQQQIFFKDVLCKFNNKE